MQKIVFILLLTFVAAPAFAQKKKKVPPPPPPPPKIVEVEVGEQQIQESNVGWADTSAQEVKSEAYPLKKQEDGVFDMVSVQEPAEFPGGYDSLRKFINQTLEYPFHAKENGIQGTVFVEFILDETGKVGHIVVKRGIADELNRETIRVCESMPAWKPAKNNGKIVKQRYIMPVRFKLP
ncbi:MAG TPA: energy transducer TonB [Flavobacteriales bacterium]|nr:energy transducer TonB [Flavobacteriales bacterium]